MTIRAALKPALAGICLQALTVFVSAPATAAGAPPSPPVQAGLAHVWFLREFDPAGSFDTPTIYANGIPVGQSRPGAVFSADFAPGTYTFTVPSEGPDTNQGASVQLAPGTQVYLDVQESGRIGMGDTEGGHGRDDILSVRQIPASWAEKYLPTLTQLPHG